MALQKAKSDRTGRSRSETSSEEGETGLRKDPPQSLDLLQNCRSTKTNADSWLMVLYRSVDVWWCTSGEIGAFSSDSAAVAAKRRGKPSRFLLFGRVGYVSWAKTSLIHSDVCKLIF